MDDMPIAEVTHIYSAINIFLKYGQAISCRDNDTVVEFRPQRLEKYWRYATQVANKLNNLQDFILALAMFVYTAQANYDRKM